MAIQLSPSFPYPRFGLFLYLVLVVLSPQPVSAVHNNTDKYTVQGLYDIIERIKPDVILVELDSLPYSLDVHQTRVRRSLS